MIDVTIEYMKVGTTVSDSLLEKFCSFDIIGFAVYDINFEYISKFTKRIKQYSQNTIVFYGSQFVTLTYDDMLAADHNVDFLVLGDGEYPITYAIENIEISSLEEIIKSNPHLISRDIFTNKYACDACINELPWPKHEKKIIRENLYCYIQSSNGCLGDCAFCARIRKKWSFRTPEDMVNEINSIKPELFMSI